MNGFRAVTIALETKGPPIDTRWLRIDFTLTFFWEPDTLKANLEIDRSQKQINFLMFVRLLARGNDIQPAAPSAARG
jgi:hypothetical protein